MLPEIAWLAGSRCGPSSERECAGSPPDRTASEHAPMLRTSAPTCASDSGTHLCRICPSTRPHRDVQVPLRQK